VRGLRTRVVSGMRARHRIGAAHLLVRLRGQCGAIESLRATAAGAKRAECASQRGLLLFVGRLVRRRGHRRVVLAAVAVPDGFRGRQRAGAGRRGLLAWPRWAQEFFHQTQRRDHKLTSVCVHPNSQLSRSGRRVWNKWFFVAAVFFCTALTALQAFPGLFAKFDDPKRLGADVQSITTNGFTLRWVEKKPATNATGRTLVFIHGSPGGAGVWAAQFESPLTNANLFAYDRPGFGHSKPVLPRPHLQMQVDSLMTLLAAATTNRVLLVGHSYGSPIALLAALEHPDQIRGALLIGGDVDPAQEQPFWVQYFFGWRATSWMLPRALRQCNREMLTARDDLAAMQKQLPQLAVPVVMLHGDHDPLVPVENVAWLEQQLGALGKTNLFAKIILPGVNHFIPWEHPAEVTRALSRLDKVADAQATGNSAAR